MLQVCGRALETFLSASFQHRKRANKKLYMKENEFISFREMFCSLIFSVAYSAAEQCKIRSFIDNFYVAFVSGAFYFAIETGTRAKYRESAFVQCLVFCDSFNFMT